jgi:hypothetical protein
MPEKKTSCPIQQNDEERSDGYLSSIAELPLITGDRMHQELPEEFLETAYGVGRTWAKRACGQETAKLPISVSDL